MAAKKVIAVKDWTCGMSDELGRVVLTINPTEGEAMSVLMTIFQAAKLAQELRAPKRLPLSPQLSNESNGLGECPGGGF